MNGAIGQIIDFCNPAFGIWRELFFKKKKLVQTLGLIAFIYICKNAVRKLKYKEVLKKVKNRQDEAKANKEKFRKKYPKVTEDQQNIIDLDFVTLQAKLQNGQLSVVEVTEAYLAKAVAVDAVTNAITEFLEDVLLRAEGLDSLTSALRGPLHGIPISLKEHIQLEGKDCTVGIPVKIGELYDRDAELVTHLKHLGAVPFCRTNLPQTCCSFDCSNPIYGVTTNFLDSKRTPGGSSGGEAALIAGKGSIIGFGSDLGGSVRIPAAMSGITSLKPTAGRLPLKGQGLDGGAPGVVGVYNTIGLMGRSAAGIEACIKAMLHEDHAYNIKGDSRYVPMPWNKDRMKSGKTLRIGWYDYDGIIEATPGCKRVVAEVVEKLQKEGHEIIPFRPPDLPKIYQVWAELIFADRWKSTLELLDQGPVDELAVGFKYTMDKTPAYLRKLIAPFVAFKSPLLATEMIADPKGAKSWELMELLEERIHLTDSVTRAWSDQNIDVLIAPGLAMPAQPTGYPTSALGYGVTYTAVYNLLNFPAGSLKVGYENKQDQEELEKSFQGYEKDLLFGWQKDGARGTEGMPLNVQVIGKPWNEELVLRVMMEVESIMKV